MKIKNSITLISILSLLFATIGCEDDFLNRPPLDELSAETFFRTTGELELYVNQFYLEFPDGGQWSGGTFYFDNGTDDLSDAEQNSFWNGETIVPVNDNGWDYSKIRSVNYFFENYQSCEDDFESYKHLVGEAYFFRAYLYFDLLKKYGDLIWVDKVLTDQSPELYVERDSRSFIAEKMVEDLDFAIEYLSEGKMQDGERLCKDVALLFKSRVCLYEGTWEKYHNGTAFGVSGSEGIDFLKLAAEAAEEVMDLNNFSISKESGDPSADYYDLFNSLDYNSNPEVMLHKKYGIPFDMWHVHRVSVNNGNLGPTASLINDYLCTDGKPISNSSLYEGNDSLSTLIKNRDPRLTQTIKKADDPLRVTEDGTVVKWYTIPVLKRGRDIWSTTGFALKKGATPEEQYFNMDEAPVMLFRYAEVLLNYAEAKAELGELTQSDVDKSVNLLRDRVGMIGLNLSTIETDANWLYPNLSPIINEIRRERHVELACEGFRKDDILRWRAHDLVVGKRPKGILFDQTLYPDLEVGTDVWIDDNMFVDPLQLQLPLGYGFRPDRDYLIPIPTYQITLNPNLEQNPGWE